MSKPKDDLPPTTWKAACGRVAIERDAWRELAISLFDFTRDYPASTQMPYVEKFKELGVEVEHD